MKPIDFRNESFEQLRERLTELRLQVFQAWQAFGPGTTRHVAKASGIDILTFRPRTTELYQMGAVIVVDDDHAATEGIYRARTLEEWMQWHSQLPALVSNQQQLLG